MSVFVSIIYTLHINNLRRGNKCSLGLALIFRKVNKFLVIATLWEIPPTELSLLGIFPSQYEIGKTALNVVPAAWLTP